jgi:hypothetical protein
MNRQRIGGTLNLSALATLAQPEHMHRPDDRQAMAAVAVDMAARGLHVRDIAHALRLAPAAVASLLDEAGQ